MSEHHIELLKLQIKREQDARDFWRWAIVYVMLGLNPFMDMATAYVNNRAIGGVAAKADTAATAASKAATVAVETKADQGQKLTAINAGVEASVAGWKAYQTKEPEDMDRAAQAVVNAERLTEQMPPAVPK